MITGIFHFARRLNCYATSTMQNESFSPTFSQIQEPFTGGFLFERWSSNLGLNHFDNQVSFAATKYSVLDAKFREDQPNQLLYAIIAIVASVALTIAGWFFKKRGKKRYLTRYGEIIDAIYDTCQHNIPDCLKQLSEIKNQIRSLYTDGTLSASHYKTLDAKIGSVETRLVSDKPNKAL